MNHIGILKDTAHSEPGIHRRGNADHRLQIHRRDPDDLDSIGHFFGWPAVGIKRYDSDFVTESLQVVCQLFDDAFDAAADMREIVITHEYDLQGLPPPCEQFVSQRGSPEGSTRCPFHTIGNSRGQLESEWCNKPTGDSDDG